MSIWIMKMMSVFASVVLSVAATAQVIDEASTTKLLNEIAASRQALGAMEVKFTERRMSPLTKEPVVSQGILSLHPEGMFRREIQGQSTMINDGENLWIYYPAFGEVEKYSTSSPGPAADAVSILSGGLRLQELERQFRVTVERANDGVRLSLAPRTGRLRKLIRAMQIDLNTDYELIRLKWSGTHDEQTTLDFSEEKSIPAESDRFRFVPPDGANVIEPLGR